MVALPRTISFWVPGGAQAASIARRSVLSVEVGLPATVRHRLALLLSELVSNAIRHGGAGAGESVQVRVASSRARVRVEVFDPGRNGNQPTDAFDEGGYGLLLVDHLSDGWGREATDSGGLAWFELDLAGLGDS